MTASESITIRRASGADASALDRLAGLDSRRLPHDDFLIAEVAGEAWAAAGVRSGVVVANPFRPAGDVADLLRLRAKRMREAGAGSARRGLRRLTPPSGFARRSVPRGGAPCGPPSR